jgi:hypothetical protein
MPQAHQVRSRFNISMADEFGQGQDKGIPSLNEIAVTRKESLFKFMVDFEQIPVEQIRVVLNPFQAQW